MNIFENFGLRTKWYLQNYLQIFNDNNDLNNLPNYSLSFITIQYFRAEMLLLIGMKSDLLSYFICQPPFS